MGVILRRGPSKWVRLIKWDTRHDRFERGQWFHGRIYEHRCDLSPDGRLLIYFASKQTARQGLNFAYTNTWTAISKPPWLTALALWPKGDCWHGGGLFLDGRTVWLNHLPAKAKAHPDHQPWRLRVLPNPEAHGEDGPIAVRRLRRDGWKLKDPGRFVRVGSRYRTERPEVWERKSGRSDVTLISRCTAIAPGAPGGASVMQYALRRAHGDEYAVEGATWADWDQRGRLVFARAGKLLAGNVDDPARLTARDLVDFSDERPEPMPPPSAATRW